MQDNAQITTRFAKPPMQVMQNYPIGGPVEGALAKPPMQVTQNSQLVCKTANAGKAELS
jgi:hypothetical protein